MLQTKKISKEDKQEEYLRRKVYKQSNTDDYPPP
jgi:hypothetical protein